MNKEDKDNAINAIIKQRESLSHKDFLECPVCAKKTAKIDEYRPDILVCYSCMKHYELNKLDLEANKG